MLDEVSLSDTDLELGVAGQAIPAIAALIRPMHKEPGSENFVHRREIASISFGPTGDVVEDSERQCSRNDSA